VDGLREHLQKSEIEYIASHGGGYPETFKWDKDIESQSKRIGFRIKDRWECEGEEVILTSSNITIGLLHGFVYKNNEIRLARKGF